MTLSTQTYSTLKNDDGPDAMQMAVEIARKPRIQVGRFPYPQYGDDELHQIR